MKQENWNLCSKVTFLLLHLSSFDFHFFFFFFCGCICYIIITIFVKFQQNLLKKFEVIEYISNLACFKCSPSCLCFLNMSVHSSIHPSIHPLTYLPACLPACLINLPTYLPTSSTYLSIYLPHQPTYLTTYLINLPIYLPTSSTCLSTYLPACLSICFQYYLLRYTKTGNPKKGTLRVFLIFYDILELSWKTFGQSKKITCIFI